MDIERICEDYLLQMTPTAQKMAEDVIQIKDRNKQIWANLSHKERSQLLDRSLIDAKLEQEYQRSFTNNEYEYESLSQFSWFSRSQLDLFKYIDTKPTCVISPLKRSENASSAVHKDASGDKAKPLEEKVRVKSHLSKPKNPPPPPPKKVHLEEIQIEDFNQGDMPKTGFDFLDNW